MINHIERTITALGLATLIVCLVLIGKSIDHMNQTFDQMAVTLDKIQYDLTVTGIHAKKAKR